MYLFTRNLLYFIINKWPIFFNCSLWSLAHQNICEVYYANISSWLFNLLNLVLVVFILHLNYLVCLCPTFLNLIFVDCTNIIAIQGDMTSLLVLIDFIVCWILICILELRWNWYWFYAILIMYEFPTFKFINMINHTHLMFVHFYLFRHFIGLIFLTNINNNFVV